MPTTYSAPSLQQRHPLNTRDLTPDQNWLVQTIRGCQFGRIENLRIRVGQPVPNQDVKIVRATHLSVTAAGSEIIVDGGYELKREFVGLFVELARVGDGTITRLEFRHGVPYLLETLHGEPGSHGLEELP